MSINKSYLTMSINLYKMYIVENFRLYLKYNAREE